MTSGRRNVRLTLAINDSDQVRDVLSGAVPVDGMDLTTLHVRVDGPQLVARREARG